MGKTALCLTLILITCTGAHAGTNTKYFAFYAQYNSYNDITNSGDAERKYLSSDVSANLDLRLYRIFILTLHGGQSIDSSRSFTGAGFKVDMPGFFMLGGNIVDLIRRKKRRGINTSIDWKSFVISEESESSLSVGNRFSFSADIHLSESLFLNLDLGLYSHKGDQHLSPTFGLGFEF